MTMESNERFKAIPQVEKLLQHGEISFFIPELGRTIVAEIVRDEIASFRERLRADDSLSADELTAGIVRRCRFTRLEKLQRVINGTGVLIHTNLGRAPFSKEILKKLADSLDGYCNLELSLPERKRGKRGGYAERLLCVLTGAQDALVVNNNASAVYLILHQFCRGRGVLVSRGELIQIGGGFRIPDIMHETGAHLVEVGTTNITELEDYRKAITPETAMILSMHRSNFKQSGFCSSPSLKDISGLKTETLLFVRDLGSGNLVRDQRLGPSFEPTVDFELAQGADLVCFSGDKLLGACQAGLIVGRRDLIVRLKRNPLMRMLRVDKISYLILQETLISLMNGRPEDVSLWEIILQPKEAIDKKINRLMRSIKSPLKKDMVKKLALFSTFGGGALPGAALQSAGIQIEIPGISAESIAASLIKAEVPVIGYIVDGRFTLDLRTIRGDELPALAEAIDRLIADHAAGAE